MYIKQIYTSCLAEAAYYIESDGKAVIIDPLREVDPYIALAKERNAEIIYIFETHFHADFISGHIDLSKKTGAPIVFGPNAEADFDFYSTTDNEIFKIGKLKLQVLHTPGHTIESSCYLLFDEFGQANAIFTGDTLFVGDVGRPDLAVKSDLSQKDLAGLLYQSLKEKIKPLDDSVIVYPAHGAGSSCGKNIGSETFSTIGEQKKLNYALQDMSRDTFIEVVTDGLMAPPKYFFDNARINRTGYSSLESVLEKTDVALDIATFKQEIESGSLIIDTRHPEEFATGFIGNSISIGTNGMLAIWAGSLIELNRSIVIVAESKEMAHESILRLARVGIENIHGYLSGGISTWRTAGFPLENVNMIQASEFETQTNKNTIILDVRRPTEFENGHVEFAENHPLDVLEEEVDRLDHEKTYLVYCAAGYRSMIAASILKKAGIRNIINVKGGYTELEKTSVKIKLEPKEN